MTPDSLHVSERELIGPLGRLVIALLPDSCREAVVGDLVEEASTSIVPASGTPAARQWLKGQLVRSIPGMISLHFRQKENDEMKHAKWIAAAAIVLMGAVQAWDSGILAAPLLIGAIVVLAIALGVAGVFVKHEGIQFGIAVFVLILLATARILSPVRLPELSLVGMPIFLILVLGPRFLALRKEKRNTGGPPSPA